MLKDLYLTISLRKYLYKPMKLEENILQENVFKIRPIPIFYNKYFFRYLNWNRVHKFWKIFVGPFHQEIIALNQWNSREIFSKEMSLKWDRFQYSPTNTFSDISTQKRRPTLSVSGNRWRYCPRRAAISGWLFNG